jgi:glyoxylase-like metal-dependent hydrolase (beta-lactamase superfamily II)
MALTRRLALAAPALAVPALLLGGATLAPRQAAAQTAAAQTAAALTAAAQAPGFYRFKLGDYTVTVINDGVARRPKPDEGFVRNATPEQVRAALEADFLPTAHFDNTFNVTVLQTGRETIMFDTGTGGLLAPTAGTMWDNLRAAGIDPAAIDRVIFTHFHGDHVSGLVTREGAARFPKAELVVPAPEWAFWTGDRAPEPAKTMVAGRFKPYEGRVRQVAPNADLGGGIVGIPTHGHTPGHTCWGIQNGGASVIVLGDVTNHPVFNLQNPDWRIIFDMDADAAATTRRAFFDRAAADKTPIIGYHWPFPAVARVRTAGQGFALAPIQWSSGI